MRWLLLNVDANVDDEKNKKQPLLFVVVIVKMGTEVIVDDDDLYGHSAFLSLFFVSSSKSTGHSFSLYSHYHCSTK